MDQRLRYRDYPFEKVVAKADDLIKAGHTVYQKFTCTGCGARLTIEQPNVFHRYGTCDRCPATTNIWARGCNYMVVLGGPSDLSRRDHGRSDQGRISHAVRRDR
jgi:hypothetical protein